jgi:hypothetical protein
MRAKVCMYLMNHLCGLVTVTDVTSPVAAGGVDVQLVQRPVASELVEGDATAQRWNATARSSHAAT